MTLRITAENGTANDYTIAVKNDYQWAKDYVHGQQGNVWFAQAKIDGEWQNMTEVEMCIRDRRKGKPRRAAGKQEY